MGDLALGIDCSSRASKVVAWDRNGLAGVGDLFVTSTGGRNIRVGRLLAGGLLFSTPEHEWETSPLTARRRSRSSAGRCPS